MSKNTSGNMVFLFITCLVAALGGFLFGFDTGVVSGTTESLEKLYNLTPVTKGWFVGSALWGCVLGALLAGTLADKFGRKPVLVLASILFFISAVGCGFPPNYPLLVVARFVGGLGVGVASMIAPLYISEIAPANHRGRLVAIFQFAIVIGLSLSYYSNALILTISTNYPETAQKLGLSLILVEQNWRGMFLAETIPALLFFFSIFLIPESPRFLAKIGKWEKTLDIMKKIHGTQTAEKEVAEIKNSLNEETGKISELFGKYKFGLLIAVLLMFFSQFTGINVIMYYGPEVFKAAGFSESFSFWIQSIVGTANIVFTVIALWKVDSLGRKPLMIIGTACVFTILAFVAILFAMQGIVSPKIIQICMPIFVVLFVAAFA
ncbi:MAG: sugar porter family MFS transporter, partial [Thermoguttaceae bacterium]